VSVTVSLSPEICEWLLEEVAARVELRGRSSKSEVVEEALRALRGGRIVEVAR
jgi:Arc/MetJ-type ribon-helix-helix transcriptional regulator